MRAGRIVLKFACVGAVVVVFAFLAVRIFSHNSPTVDVLGSYFPAWMVCILSGLTLTLVVHWIVQILNLRPYVGPPPLIYLCLMIIFTFATWIVYYQN
jgi:hypothetical protein